MKKLPCLIMAVLITAGLLSACGQQPAAPSDETTLPSTATQPTTEPAATDSQPSEAEPSEQPTQDTGATEPTDITPTEPVEIPTEPATVPTEPTELPTEPSTVPTEPAEIPTEPATVPTEHIHSYSSAVTKPTCTTGGYTTYTCTCGDRYTGSKTAATGHTYQHTVTAPTCTASGYTTHTCSVCGDQYTDSKTAATGHSWSEWGVTKEPTYSASGTKTRSCSLCGHSETQSIPKLEMTASEQQQEVLRLVNIEREKAGVAPLEYVSSIQGAADTRASEIRQKFSHTRPDGTSCFTVLDDYSIAYRTAGENIAYGYGTPEAVVEGWMNSDGHRANILNPNFTGLVVGVENSYWVQLFVGI